MPFLSRGAVLSNTHCFHRRSGPPPIHPSASRLGVQETIVEVKMSRVLCRSAVFGCLLTLLAAFMFSSPVEARQHGFGGFFFAPFFSFGPRPGRHRYYAPPRKRYYAHSRKRRVVRSERRNFAQLANRRAALAMAKARNAEGIAARELPEKKVAVPNGATGALPLINCEKAQAIVAEYGFKHIKAELCIGENFEFHATRDGKPFLIEIEAANGELAKVRRLR